jgi:hypothetical protein
LKIGFKRYHVDWCTVPFRNGTMMEAGEFGLFMFEDPDRHYFDGHDWNAFAFPELLVVVAPKSIGWDGTAFGRFRSFGAARHGQDSETDKG